MAALSGLILQMVTYFHAGSHIKPRRVKTHMQMRAGRKGHKKNEYEAAKLILCFAFATVFYFGQELIRGETECRDRPTNINRSDYSFALEK